MSRKKEMQEQEEQIQEEIRRVKLPRDRQTFAILEARLGASRVRARCFDGKVRVCRIPGRLKRKLWVREGDFVLVEPWELNGDAKGDVIFKYRHSQIEYLKRRGLIKNLQDFEEF